MHYDSIPANDGCPLAFQTSIPLAALSPPKNNKLILLLHGFSGSSAYFTRNFAALTTGGSNTAKNSNSDPVTPKNDPYWVLAPDMRGHGRSGRPRRGYHVARLAADLHDLIAHLRSRFADAQTQSSSSSSTSTTKLQITAIGCSIGAAVLWTYAELYGSCAAGDFAGMIFVDQAPLQDRVWLGEGHEDNWDVDRHHKGCFDEASLAGAQRAWMLPPGSGEVEETYRGLVRECLGYWQGEGSGGEVSDEEREEDERFFMGISRECDGRWLARLVADHTRYDHREAIERIDVPCLVMAGRKSGCFPLEGILETARRIEKGGGRIEVSVFECGHWLFYEDAERFNKEVLDFVGRWMV